MSAHACAGAVLSVCCKALACNCCSLLGHPMMVMNVESMAEASSVISAHDADRPVQPVLDHALLIHMQLAQDLSDCPVLSCKHLWTPSCACKAATQRQRSRQMLSSSGCCTLRCCNAMACTVPKHMYLLHERKVLLLGAPVCTDCRLAFCVIADCVMGSSTNALPALNVLQPFKSDLDHRLSNSL